MSNINNNNQMKEVCTKLLNMISVEEFYSNILTRVNILNLYEKNMTLIRSLPIDENNVVRCLAHNFLRYVNMSVQQLDVLMFLGLQQITINDLKLSETDLITKLVSQNKDNSDIHIIERILSQINNNLPHDLRGKFTPVHKQKIIKLLNGYTPFKDNLKYFHDTQGQGNKEHFTSLDNNFLDTFSNGSNNANNNVLSLNNLPNANDYNNLKAKGYELKDYLNSVKMEIDQGTYEEQLKQFIDKKAKMIKVLENSNNKETSDKKLRAMYINKNPDIHYSPVDKQFYFYEHASGSLVDVDDAETILNLEIDADKPKLSLAQKKLFEKTLKKYNIPRDRLDNAVKYIETIDTTSGEEDELEEDTIGKDYNNVNNLKNNVDSEQEVKVLEEEEPSMLSKLIDFTKSKSFMIAMIVLIVLLVVSYIISMLYKKQLVSIKSKKVASSKTSNNLMNNYKSSTVSRIRSSLVSRNTSRTNNTNKGKGKRGLVPNPGFRKIN